MSMVTLPWTVHIRYLLQEPQQSTTNLDHTKAAMPGQAPDTTMKTGTDEVIPGHNHISTDITAQVIMTHIQTTPDHDTGIIATILEVVHNAHIPHTEITAIDPTAAHHINLTADHPCTEVPHPTTLEITIYCSHVHPTNPPGVICTGHIHIPADHAANHMTRRTPE